jgi:hypothetical protein
MSKIEFGKYNGKSVSDVFDTDPGYTEWIFGKYQYDGSFKDIAPEIGQYLRQEDRLTTAEKALSLGRLGYSDIAAMQNGDKMTVGQGERFMALVNAAVEAGIIEMED